MELGPEHVSLIERCPYFEVICIGFNTATFVRVYVHVYVQHVCVMFYVCMLTMVFKNVQESCWCRNNHLK